jgi:MFS family permease
MTAEALQDILQKARHSARRGWIVVASAFGIMFVTFGAAYSFSSFFASLQAAFDAPRGAVSLIFSIAVPLYFLLGAVSGPLADRVGPRPTCLFGIVIAGAGLIFAGSASALWQVAIGFGLGIGFGIGFSYVPAIGAVQRWFVARRGIASGIAVSGIGVGTLVAPIVAAALIDALGWRGAWIVLGLCVVVLGIFATFFIDNAPERQGLLPDGGVIDEGAYRSNEAAPGVSLRTAIRTRAFGLLYVSLIAVSIGAFIPFVHLTPFAEDHGLSHSMAVAIFSLVGIGSAFGRFALGGLADRLGRRRSLIVLLAGIALMQGWWLVASSAWQMALFALVFGTCFGGSVALFPALTVDYFGGRNASGIIGVLYTAAAIGSALGPKLAGDAFDMLGSYTLPIAIAAGFSAVGTLCVALAPEPGAR